MGKALKFRCWGINKYIFSIFNVLLVSVLDGVLKYFFLYTYRPGICITIKGNNLILLHYVWGILWSILNFVCRESWPLMNGIIKSYTKPTAKSKFIHLIKVHMRRNGIKNPFLKRHLDCMTLIKITIAAARVITLQLLRHNSPFLGIFCGTNNCINCITNVYRFVLQKLLLVFKTVKFTGCKNLFGCL